MSTGRIKTLQIMPAFSLLTKHQVIDAKAAQGLTRKYMAAQSVDVDAVVLDLCSISVPEGKEEIFSQALELINSITIGGGIKNVQAE